MRRRKKIRKLMIVVVAALMLFLSTMIISWAFCQEERKEAGAEIANESPEELWQKPKEIHTEEYNQSTGIPSMDWDADESYLLAKIAMAEAEGESTEGKAMVILVVLNRVWSKGFPGSIEEVIFEEHDGRYQFSPVQPGGRWWNVEPDEDCWKALHMIMVEHWDESEGALYFEATYNGEDTWHSKNLEYIKTVGNHNFYK